MEVYYTCYNGLRDYYPDTTHNFIQRGGDNKQDNARPQNENVYPSYSETNMVEDRLSTPTTDIPQKEANRRPDPRIQWATYNHKQMFNLVEWKLLSFEHPQQKAEQKPAMDTECRGGSNVIWTGSDPRLQRA